MCEMGMRHGIGNGVSSTIASREVDETRTPPRANPKHDLEEYVTACDKFDTKLVAKETKSTVDNLTETGATEIADLSTELFAKTKEAQKKATALSAWFRM